MTEPRLKCDTYALTSINDAVFAMNPRRNPKRKVDAAISKTLVVPPSFMCSRVSGEFVRVQDALRPPAVHSLTDSEAAALVESLKRIFEHLKVCAGSRS
jgi:hypothetical protein